MQQGGDTPLYGFALRKACHVISILLLHLTALMLHQRITSCIHFYKEIYFKSTCTFVLVPCTCTCTFIISSRVVWDLCCSSPEKEVSKWQQHGLKRGFILDVCLGYVTVTDVVQGKSLYHLGLQFSEELRRCLSTTGPSLLPNNLVWDLEATFDFPSSLTIESRFSAVAK